MTNTTVPTSTSAARMRRYRQRKVEGEVVIQRLRLGRVSIDSLTRLGWLSPEDSTNPRAVARAIARLAGEALDRRLMPPR